MQIPALESIAGGLATTVAVMDLNKKLDVITSLKKRRRLLRRQLQMKSLVQKSAAAELQSRLLLFNQPDELLLS